MKQLETRVRRALLKHRDPRLGVCMDAGWITSTGMDPTKVFKDYEGRVYDIHLKDKRVEKTVGEDVAFDTNIGEGQGKLENLFAELKRTNWPGILREAIHQPTAPRCQFCEFRIGVHRNPRSVTRILRARRLRQRPPGLRVAPPAV